MAFSNGKQTHLSLEEILSITTEADILYYYLGISQIPCIIHSPLREDKRPSFGLYSNDGNKIYYTDLSTKDKGGLFDLLGKLWGISYTEVLIKISNDINNFKGTSNINILNNTSIKSLNNYRSESTLECKVREWKDYDLEFWNSFGISKRWLEYADVYPISHKIIIKNDEKFVFSADKYAYAYVEFKDKKTTLKIYQPFNTKGFKWSNNHDRSVISLWTKVPANGLMICICASLKDALCLWANTGIPSIAVQGEGYSMSNTAIEELKRRFKHVYILFDNDEAGIIDGVKLAEQTGFTNIVLPRINETKDISDLYKSLENKEQFKELMINLFKNN
jgi:hypothetical protein